MTTKEIQEWLCLHGLLVKVDGIDGPATQAAVKKFQARNCLSNYEHIDNMTIALLRHPLAAASTVSGLEAVSFSEAVVKVAQRYLGYHPREVGGENSGPWVRHFMQGNQGINYPWCAGSVSVILDKARQVFANNPFYYTMSCDDLANQAYNQNRFTADPKGLNHGSLFLMRGKVDGDWIHTGVVTAFNKDHYTTIEGNTNDDGNREGTEMCARIRAYRNVDFIRL